MWVNSRCYNNCNKLSWHAHTDTHRHTHTHAHTHAGHQVLLFLLSLLQINSEAATIWSLRSTVQWCKANMRPQAASLTHITPSADIFHYMVQTGENWRNWRPVWPWKRDSCLIHFSLLSDVVLSVKLQLVSTELSHRLLLNPFLLTKTFTLKPSKCFCSSVCPL